MYTSIRLLNYKDFQEIWAAGEIYQFMSRFGYILTGQCDVPVQYEFLFDVEDEEEPPLKDLELFFALHTDFKLEIERYTIDEI
jgi:hypothetical protein